jgi:SAM-dependent methyltransferase
LNELLDPSKHPDWLEPHSIEWYEQLGELYRKYEYPWNSLLTKPNGESIFDEEVFSMIQGKKVLDVGCGHGEYAILCSSVAKEVIGFDVTDSFVESGNENKKMNVTFVVGNIKNGLPFEQGEFDCAYIRKGPTSAYPLLNQVVKKGGQIVGLHPGDDSGKELPSLFPNLFKQNKVNILDTIKQRLKKSKFSHTDIEIVNSIEYIQSPNDVLKLCCFGQKDTVFNEIKNKNMQQISRLFEQNALSEGLAITFQRYIVRALV